MSTPTEDPDDLSDDVELAEGTQVGEYEITGRIGGGGFGTVYSAVHPLIGKQAAVKVLRREFSANKEMVSRFIDEARAANTIRHANIIDIFNFGILDDGRRYFVMELLDGVSLDSYIQEHAPLEPALTLLIMRGVVRALDAAHEQGVVHRDLKPDNIFLTFDDEGKPQPKLLDFGIAKLLGDAKTISGHKTRTGSPVGTPSYMAPEQCLGETIDETVDVYAFGQVCFEALTGKPPFSGRSFLELMNKQTSAERPRASEVNPKVPRQFDEPLRRIMAIDKQARPQSVGEAFDLLCSAADDAGIDIDSVGVPKTSFRVRSANIGTSSDTYAQSAATIRADTLGSSILGVSKPRRTGLILLGGALVLGVAVYLATARLDAEPAADPAADPPAAASTPATTADVTTSETTSEIDTSPAPSTTSAPVARTFEMTVTPKVMSAQLFIDGRLIGSLPGVFDIPEDGKEHSLTIRAAGFQPVVIKRVLEPGAVVEVTLKPAPSTSPDLENPF